MAEALANRKSRKDTAAAHLIIPGSAFEAPDPWRPGGLILCRPLHGCLLALRWLGLTALADVDPLPSAHDRSVASLLLSLTRAPLLFLTETPQIAGQLASFRVKNRPVGCL